MPIIGVTACRSIDDYLKSVARAGGDARVLDPKADAPATVAAELDGLLLTGGVDVDPARYGEARKAMVSNVDPERDAFEIALIAEAVARNVPVLGICRGLQILNVAMGGSLYQDLPTENPTSLEHSKAATPFCIAHDVWISPGSRLAALMPEKMAEADSCAVNSRHHQAIKRLADGFEVSATAPDGVIEGIEHTVLPFCVAVQWHPENFWRTGEFRELFESFVEATRRSE
ncbi:MAG: gamma-glutamyl-gamma-aminobutyrate hydrolase family protein [Bacteroidales bacterium]